MSERADVLRLNSYINNKKYFLVEVLGQGGFGTVYKAHKLKGDVLGPVALKIQPRTKELWIYQKNEFEVFICLS